MGEMTQVAQWLRTLAAIAKIISIYLSTCVCVSESQSGGVYGSVVI